MSKLLKVLLRLLVFLGVFRLSIVGATENGLRKIKNIGITEGNVKKHHHRHHHHHHHHQYHVKENNMGRSDENSKRVGRSVSKFDLNYMSKRKIPNGPDPIHNRRQTPGRQA